MIPWTLAEMWHFIFQSALIALGVLGVIILIVTAIEVNMLDGSRAEHLLKTQVTLSKAKERQKQAESSLAKLMRSVGNSRTIDAAKAEAVLRHRPKGAVEIKYLEGNTEVEVFAKHLQRTLTDNGWIVYVQTVGVEVINSPGITLETGSEWADTGLFVSELQEPGQTLLIFIQTCVEGDIGPWTRTNENMQKDSSIVLVGPKLSRRGI